MKKTAKEMDILWKIKGAVVLNHKEDIQILLKRSWKHWIFEEESKLFKRQYYWRNLLLLDLSGWWEEAVPVELSPHQWNTETMWVVCYNISVMASASLEG